MTRSSAQICLLLAAGIALLSPPTASALPLKHLLRSNASVACHSATGKDVCSQSNCTWCSSSLLPSGCFLDAETTLLPTWIYTCDTPSDLLLSEASLASGSPCKDALNETACGAALGCVWCAKSGKAVKPWGKTGKCVSEAKSAWLPPKLFNCSAKADAPAAALLKPKPAPKPAPAATCTDAVTKAACKDVDGCTWCSYAPSAAAGKNKTGTCVTEAAAAWLPPQIFMCGKPSDAGDNDEAALANTLVSKAKPVKPEPAPKCKDATTKGGCKDVNGCVWCDLVWGGKLEGASTSGKCESEAAAAWLPPQVFKCGSPSKKPKVSLVAKPTASNTCKDLYSKGACEFEDGCVWCEMTWAGAEGAGKCETQAGSGWLPPQMFNCSSKPSPASLSAPVEPPCKDALTKNACEGGDGCVWCEYTMAGKKAGIGKCESESKAAWLPPKIFTCSKPKSAEVSFIAASEPEPESESAAPVCKDSESEAECTGVKGCVWCEMTWGAKTGGKCMSESKSQYLPPVMFKCKLPKHTEDAYAAVLSNPMPGPDPATLICNLAMDKDNCQGTEGCVWCQATFGPVGICKSVNQAAWLPPTAYTCTKPKPAVAIS